MKTWTEKLNSPKPHEVKTLHVDMSGMKAGQIMLIPSAKIIDSYIRTIPAGTSIDTKTMRDQLAKQYGAEVSCPIVTGILLRIVAEAAYEAFNNGSDLDKITPFWRVLDEQTPTTKKLSFGPDFVTEQRQEEGI